MSKVAIADTTEAAAASISLVRSPGRQTRLVGQPGPEELVAQQLGEQQIASQTR
jgi:hypothetical protein